MSLRKLTAIALSFFLWGCVDSTPPSPAAYNHVAYGQINSTREFGVVVSVKEMTKNSSPGFFASVGNLFSSKDSEPQQSSGNVTAIRYVIDKNDGKRVMITQIPEEGEPILYPGQKVLLHTNGEYVRVYKADVEGQRN